jgi:predicted nuclease with TOPRIM domain
VAEVERTIGEIRERLERSEAESEELRARRDALEREVAEKREEIERLMNTRTFRYTAPLRRAWGQVRRPRNER